MSGYICLYRKLFENEIFKREKFSEREAWVWMITQAAYKNHDWRHENRVIKLKRGQLIASLRYLASKWGWTHTKVMRFLKLLKNETMIETANETGITVVTIKNYAKYQDLPTENETPPETLDDTTVKQSRNNTKKDKKDNKSKYTSIFEKFWKEYPRTTNVPKKHTAKQFEKALTKTNPEILFQGLATAKREWAKEKRPTDKMPHPATWLNQERWDIETEAPFVSPDYTDPKYWRAFMGDPNRPAWKRQWKKYYRNNWPGHEGFPNGCPQEILKTHYPELFNDEAAA